MTVVPYPEINVIVVTNPSKTALTDAVGFAAISMPGLYSVVFNLGFH